MKIGNLVQKIKGYGAEEGWTGIILGFDRSSNSNLRAMVITADGIEHWMVAMIKVIGQPNETG